MGQTCRDDWSAGKRFISCSAGPSSSNTPAAVFSLISSSLERVADVRTSRSTPFPVLKKSITLFTVSCRQTRENSRGTFGFLHLGRVSRNQRWPSYRIVGDLHRLRIDSEQLVRRALLRVHLEHHAEQGRRRVSHRGHQGRHCPLLAKACDIPMLQRRLQPAERGKVLG